MPYGRCVTTTSDRTRRPLYVTEATSVLSKTPGMLNAWLRGLPSAWLAAHEGGDTWCPSDVVSHLIQAERTNWMPRARHLRAYGTSRPFEPFERMAAMHDSLEDRLDEFTRLRAGSLAELAELGIDESALAAPGAHPALGPVTLGQLLAAWVVHDLDHITQIARVMALQYADAVGPWRAYLRVVSGQPSR